jgi:hypothetical protein
MQQLARAPVDADQMPLELRERNIADPPAAASRRAGRERKTSDFND